jgi:hypothetical protein
MLLQLQSLGNMLDTVSETRAFPLQIFSFFFKKKKQKKTWDFQQIIYLYSLFIRCLYQIGIYMSDGLHKTEPCRPSC